MTGSAGQASRMRLLPVLIVALAALGTVKSTSLFLTGSYALLPISPATAQDVAAGSPDAIAPAADTSAATGGTSSPDVGDLAEGNGEKPSEIQELAAPGRLRQNRMNRSAIGADKSDIAGQRRIELADPGAPSKSDSERLVLESLRVRREELETREKELEMRERLLAAAEQRIDEKISELKEIEARVEESFKIRDDFEDEQFADLVKMYETMKPKKAARIFNRLELEVLVGVAKRMRPPILADVIAAMDPAVAERVTIELARLSSQSAGPALDELAPVAPQ